MSVNSHTSVGIITVAIVDNTIIRSVTYVILVQSKFLIVIALLIKSLFDKKFTKNNSFSQTR